MNIANAILTILLLSQALTTGQEMESRSTKNVKRTIEVWCSGSSINGTTFKTEDTYQKDEKGWSLHQCRIGYERQYNVWPVLDLPDLTNDVYWVEFTDGGMVVTAHEAKRKIVTLHLDGIAPNMITKPQTKSGENIVELDAYGCIKPKATGSALAKSESNDSALPPGDFEDIDGTTLSICHALPSETEPEKSAPSSVIGYKRESAERSTFTPVLSLPYLQNDRYVVKFAKGSILVKTKNHGNYVVGLNLENLAPSAITVAYGEQPGADQPATKPADKTPVKDQPSTPASKNCPR